MKTQQIDNNTYYYNVTQDEAIEVNDYPWGFRIKTTRKYWIETRISKNENSGRQRFCFKTLNPKTDKWCAPKKSTYGFITILVKNNENGHIGSTGLSMWSKEEDKKKFLEKHGDYLSDWQTRQIKASVETGKEYSKLLDESKKRAENHIKTPRPELNLSDKIVWTEQEIAKSPIDLDLIAFDITGTAIKNRCRKFDHHYKRLGFIDFKVEYMPETLEKIALKYVNENFKEVKSMHLIIKKVTFNAPTKESPLFYGFKEELMSHLSRTPLL